MVGRRGARFIAIVGSKKTGKTTLATFLVHRLVRKGYRVASIKHVHHRGFSMDTPGKDSWCLTKAGSHTVVVISPDEMGQVTRLGNGLNRQLFPLAVKTASSIRPDIIVIEGFASMLHSFCVLSSLSLWQKMRATCQGRWAEYVAQSSQFQGE